MMRRSYTGRQAPRRLSEYHMGLHVTAQQEACAMLALLKAGKDMHEIGKAYGITATAVRARLKRQGLI